MTKLIPNRSFNVQRNGKDVVGLTGLSALCLPARPEVVALQGETPAGVLYEILFSDLVDVKEQDRLVSASDATETYRITGVAHVDSPRAAHSEVLAERRVGNS